LLENAKFKVKTITDVTKMDRISKKAFQKLANEHKDKLFNEYIEQYKKNNELDEHLHKPNTDVDKQFHKMQERVEFLGIEYEENVFVKKNVTEDIIKDIVTYKDMILDDHKYADHYKLHTLLLKTKVLDQKLDKNTCRQFDIDILTSNVSKVKLIRELEKSCKIGFLDVEFKSEKIKVDISETLHKSIKKAFRCNKEIPSSIDELHLYYVDLLRHINGDIIQTKRVGTGDDRKMEYRLNIETIQHHSYLYQRKYKMSMYHDYCKELFTAKIEKKQKKIPQSA
jgi:hypothetical protein